MAFAMVISLMPVALAAGTEPSGGSSTTVTPLEDDKKDDGNQNTPPEDTPKHEADTSKLVQGENNTHYYACKVENCNEKFNEAPCSASTWTQKTAPSCTAKGSEEGTCACRRTLTRDKDPLGHDLGYQTTQDGTHYQKCKREGCSYQTKAVPHEYGTDGKCVCNAENIADAAKIELTSSSKVNLDLSGTKTADIGIVFKDADSAYTTKKATVTYDTSDRYVATVSSDGRITAEGVGTATITASLSNREYVTVSVTVKDSDAGNVSVTIYSDTTYYLDDKDDKGGKSVLDQIDDYIYSRNGGGLNRISFSQVTDTYGDLDAKKNSWYYDDEAADISFEPDGTGTATFDYEAEGTNGSRTYSGTISIKVEKGSATSGDITYTATAGKDVTFDAKSFDDFWTDEYSSGILDYVTFSTSSSNGTLYDEDGSKLTSSSKCYYDPSSSRQIDLDGVYFEPKSSKAGTVKISFTAYGLNKKNGTDKELSGTVVITYLNGDIDDITYKPGANGKVDLVAKDFTDVFKAATGSSTSSLTITFTSLPDNGTLTYGSRDTKVTKSTTFKTSGSGNKISDVTYTASGSKSDTITYTAASGSTKITGKIIFNPTPANISLQVPYTCTSANGVTFSTADFTSRASALTNNHTIAFGQPSNGNGGLYYTGIGTKIDAGIRIPVSTLNTVTYRPAANGSTSITCIIYDATGTIVGSGTISITVTGVTTTPTNPTNPTTPGTTTPTVNDFRDVAADAWYRNDLSRLVNLGVVSGVTSSKFEPLGELNYGAALKLICKAVDVTQPEASGAQWAINYKNYAVQQGWITSDVDLTATIYRTEVAQIAAKALNLSPSSAKPFADSNDPYVAAMNAAGIIRGNDSGLFKGESSLRRSEICAIVCRMLDYRANSFNNEKPGWL